MKIKGQGKVKLFQLLGLS